MHWTVSMVAGAHYNGLQSMTDTVGKGHYRFWLKILQRARGTGKSSTLLLWLLDLNLSEALEVLKCQKALDLQEFTCQLTQGPWLPKTFDLYEVADVVVAGWKCRMIEWRLVVPAHNPNKLCTFPLSSSSSFHLLHSIRTSILFSSRSNSESF